MLDHHEHCVRPEYQALHQWQAGDLRCGTTGFHHAVHDHGDDPRLIHRPQVRGSARYAFDYRINLAAHTPTDVPDEHTYAELWLQQVSIPDSLQAQAVKVVCWRTVWRGCLSPDTCLCGILLQTPTDGTAAFAVSEDRKNDPPLLDKAAPQ